MLGISIYLNKDHETSNKNWLEQASKQGFSSIFTSIHIPEDDPETYSELLYNLSTLAKHNHMDLMVDVSRESLNHLNVDIQNVHTLLEWGITGLRLDYGFSVKEIVNLSKQLNVSLNASTLTEQRLQELIEAGLFTENVEASHNFYPRPETGLSKEYFIEKNKLFKKYHIKVSAFIPGDGEKRHPLYKGLPTLEVHRESSLVEAYLELSRSCLVDSVYIGDLSLQPETLEKFSYLKDGLIPIRYDGSLNGEPSEIYSYLNEGHPNRLDSAHQVIRFARSRGDLRHESKFLKPHNTVDRPKGSITIDNEKYGRYAGEIQITRYDLAADPKVNVIGQVIEEDLPLLEYVGGGQKVILQKMS